MLWLNEWNAWSARLAVAKEGMRLIVEQRLGPSEMEWLEKRTIAKEILELYRLLAHFRVRFARHLPQEAAAALEEFVSADGTLFTEKGFPSGSSRSPMRLLLLSKVKAQVDYFLSDTQAQARRAVERAFTHLQRSIVADDGFRRKWGMAFEGTRGEEACEKLGSVHLLSHGIWAFKADAVGGKTDLILGRDVRDEEAIRAADALVLTEWKLVRRGEDAQKKAMEAFDQAERYTRGALAGFELSSHRYLVLVSEDWLAHVPIVSATAGRIYEVRNIAVNPSPPSVAARAAVVALGGDLGIGASGLSEGEGE
ncbi:hypothetical protein [Myxococcus xanthus]|uniref:hypothetical protein n=1 Tax=Myxococcus xanthus TaxID=34 RepID=UPI001163F876|nr:hypothetical protein [Myxococcus xanthus]QDE81687.1 hypothetical protein BHS07_09030 [Myxococcus xanthus]